jgi:hypothetical protein
MGILHLDLSYWFLLRMRNALDKCREIQNTHFVLYCIGLYCIGLGMFFVKVMSFMTFIHSFIHSIDIFVKVLSFMTFIHSFN